MIVNHIMKQIMSHMVMGSVGCWNAKTDGPTNIAFATSHGRTKVGPSLQSDILNLEDH